MPLIHVQRTPGRTAEQKAQLVRDLTTRMCGPPAASRRACG
ncbi:4-oxalocrotonate tautomerase family protein [Streptomyces sp. NPDC057950]